MFLTDEIREARQLQHAARAFVGRLIPDDIALREAPMLFDELAALERVAAAGKTLLAQRVAESEVWKRAGHPSAAEYMAHKSGTSANAAAQALTTSKRLRKLPTTDSALRRGDLSTDQANAIADAASHNAGAEAALLAMAPQASLKELRDECHRAKAAADRDPEARQRRIHRGRYVRTNTDAEGAWNIHGHGTVEAGAEFGVVLNQLVDEEFDKARAEGRRESRDALAFDALQELARREWLRMTGNNPDDVTPADETTSEPATADDDLTSANVDEPTAEALPSETAGNNVQSFDDTTAGPEATASEPADRPSPVRQPPKPAKAKPRNQSLLRIDMAAIQRGHLIPGELCEVTGLGPISVETALRMLRHATVKLILTDGPDVASVTHLGTNLDPDALLVNGNGPYRSSRPPSSGVLHLALLHVDAAQLHPANLPGLLPGTETPQHDADLRQMLANPSNLMPEWVTRKIVTHGVDVAGLTYTSRRPPDALRAALLWTNPMCTVLGCNRLRVEFDHRDPWAHTHHTRHDELDCLCHHHHGLKTTEGWALIDGIGKQPMVPPNDPRHPNNDTTDRRPDPGRTTNPSPASPDTPAPRRDPAQLVTSAA